MWLPVLAGIFMGAGMFLLALDIFKIPKIKVSKAFLSQVKSSRKKVSKTEVYLENLSTFISGKLRLNEYKKLQLVSDLQSAGIDISPEKHIANAIVKSAMTSLLLIPAIYIFPLIVPIVVALIFAVYFKESRGIQEKIIKRRREIESDLPRLVFTIEKTISYNRDILQILEEFKGNTNKALRQELDITVADMRSGNYETALLRLEARVGSGMLSDVLRGLNNVLLGDDTKGYWKALSIKFSDYQRQMLKQQALRVPGKIKRLSMALMFCFLLFYMVVIVVEILDSLGAIF